MQRIASGKLETVEDLISVLEDLPAEVKTYPITAAEMPCALAIDDEEKTVNLDSYEYLRNLRAEEYPTLTAEELDKIEDMFK